MAATHLRRNMAALVLITVILGIAGGFVAAVATGLAEAINTTYNGALVTWAIDGIGPLEKRLRKQLEFALSPHTTRRWQKRS